MIIPTDGGLRPGDAKWQPMWEWLTANCFDVNRVPTDAVIEIRDDSCIGVEYYTRDANGRLVVMDGEVPRHTEWRTMTTPPPEILLP